MFNELRPQMRFNHGSMDLFGHIESDQLGKDAREGRFMGALDALSHPHIRARFSLDFSRLIRERVVKNTKTDLAIKVWQRTLCF